jgi:sulfur carrier protein ThiS
MIEKQMIVVNGMTGQETRVKAPEGTTPREIVSRLGLADYQLARVTDRRVLPQDQDVTRSVQSGERLFAFAPMVVGGEQ